MSDRYRMPARLLALLAGMTLLWGISWPVMKIVLGELEPLRFRSLTLLASAIGLFAIAAADGQPLRVPAGQWQRLLWLSFFNITSWNVLAMFGLRLMTSGRAAILAYTMPLWAILFGVWFAGEALTPRRVLGLALGMTGMALLVSGEFQSLQRAPLGALYLILCAVLWAFATVMFRRWPVSLPAAALTAWQVLLGAVPVWAGTLLFDRGPLFPSAPATWVALSYSILATSLFCLWAWTRIATEAPVAVSSLSTLMIPVIGVLSGMALLGEQPQWNDFTALALVVAALAVVLLPARRLAAGG